MLVDPTNVLFVGSTGSGKSVGVKEALERRLMKDPSMIALVLDFKNECGFYEKQNDPKLIEILGAYGERPCKIKTMILVPFLATKMSEEVLEDGWQADGFAFVKYFVLSQDSLDSKDYSLLARIGVGKTSNVAIELIDEFIEYLRMKNIPITTDNLLELSFKKIKPYRDRLRIKRELSKISNIGIIQTGRNEHSLNIKKILKFVIKNDIRVIQVCCGDLAEDLQPLRSIIARKIVEDILSIKRKREIKNKILITTLELGEYIKKFGAG